MATTKMHIAESGRTSAQETRTGPGIGYKVFNRIVDWITSERMELLNITERINEIVEDEATLLKTDVRQSKEAIANKTGIGVVEAPRGTLIHHFEVDEKGFITEANLIVATQNNILTMNESILTYAKNHIKEGNYDEKILNGAEMILRSYDPCFSCSTHAIKVHIIDRKEKSVKTLLHKKAL